MKRVQKEEGEKEKKIAEFKRLKANIDGALRVQAERYGNKDAEWIRRHL